MRAASTTLNGTAMTELARTSRRGALGGTNALCVEAFIRTSFCRAQHRYVLQLIVSNNDAIRKVACGVSRLVAPLRSYVCALSW
eukprot:5424923-Pleurochrysis_carterae.AAC.6